MSKRIAKTILISAMLVSLSSVNVYATNSSDAKNKVDSLESKKSDAQNEANSLQTQLNDLVAAVAETEDALISKGQEIIQAKADLKKAKKTEKKQYKEMKKRIRFMYEDGGEELMSVIAGANNLSDVLNKAEYVSNISNYDRNMLAKYVSTKEKVSTIKSNLETEQSELEAKEVEYQAKQEEVNELLETKKGEIENISEQLSVAAKAYADAKAAEERAAEQARQVAAATPNNNNNNNNNNNSYTPAPAPAPAPPVPSGGGGSDAVSRAQSWVGRAEYVWGACSPGAFDCSGFVSYCLTGRYARLGTTYTFLGWPQTSNPVPGDVCVNSGHCGIYVGGGQMIHAATEGVGVIYGPVQRGMIYVKSPY